MKVLDQAAKVAAQQKDEFVSCEHLLLALLDVRRHGKIGFGKIRRAPRSVRSAFWRSCAAPSRVTDETPESKFQVLEKYAINLSDRAKAGSSIRSSAAKKNCAAYAGAFAPHKEQSLPYR
jgi:ATP-dependent Clp protease ATP-binding subunit ClpB